MQKSNKRYSVFASENIVKNLKKGINLLPERIVSLHSYGMMMYRDKQNGDTYQYIPSPKRSDDGMPLGYSYECLKLSNGTTYVSEIAEHSDDRNKDVYKINGEKVTKEEFFDKISSLSLKQNDINNKQNNNTISDINKMKKKDIINTILSHRNNEALRSLIKHLELEKKAKQVLNKAIELYEQAEKQKNKLTSVFIDESIKLYNQSKFINEQADIELQRAHLLDIFSDTEDDISIFMSKLSSLINNNYFTKLNDTEYKDIIEYLEVVFSTKGLNDVIEFLLKMKNASIEYSDSLLIKRNTESITIALGITLFKFKQYSEDELLNLEEIKTTIYKNPNNRELKETKWHEFSHVLLQPLTEIIDEEQLEKMVDDCTAELLEKANDNEKKLMLAKKIEE